jgi:acetyl esterase/lipase
MNMKHLKSILFFAVITILFSCSNEEVQKNPVLIPLEYKELRNVSYGIDSNQVYDIYLPDNRNKNTKVMILVHGGGWTSGDKSSMNELINLYKIDFPQTALVNINYRLSDVNNPPYPMQINDISAVVNDLKNKKEDYVISDNFGFLGISAGGHLALLWSYAFDATNNVKMVGSIVGPTNFLDPSYLNNTNPILQELLKSYGVNLSPDYLQEISPLYHATTFAPATILFYGGQDPLVPLTQGSDLQNKLDILGVTNNFTLYPQAGHGWTGAELLDTWNKLKAFTENYLINTL